MKGLTCNWHRFTVIPLAFSRPTLLEADTLCRDDGNTGNVQSPTLSHFYRRNNNFFKTDQWQNLFFFFLLLSVDSSTKMRCNSMSSWRNVKTIKAHNNLQTDDDDKTVVSSSSLDWRPLHTGIEDLIKRKIVDSGETLQCKTPHRVVALCHTEMHQELKDLRTSPEQVQLITKALPCCHQVSCDYLICQTMKAWWLGNTENDFVCRCCRFCFWETGNAVFSTSTGHRCDSWAWGLSVWNLRVPHVSAWVRASSHSPKTCTSGWPATHL